MASMIAVNIIRRCLIVLFVGWIVIVIFHYKESNDCKEYLQDMDKQQQHQETLQSDKKAETARPWYMKGGTAWPDIVKIDPKTGRRELSLWPHEDIVSDRVVNQLMFLPPVDSKMKAADPKLILIHNPWRNWELLREGMDVFAKCPVKSCKVTLDKAFANKADAIHFLNNVNDFEPHWVRSPEQIWFFHTRESPVNGYDVAEKFKNAINWTSTYRRDSDLANIYGFWRYYDERVKRQPLGSPIDRRNFAANKTGKVAFMSSNCAPKNNRLNYVAELSKHIPVDQYGGCGTLSCPKNDNAKGCFKMLSSKYKFYLSFENSNCRDYITEKFFFNGLSQDYLPVVMGASPEDYARVAPHKSFIHVDEFEGAKELADFLHYLDRNDEAYNEYFKWKGTGEFLGAEDGINQHNGAFYACRLCAMLHDPWMPRKHYQDVRDWWGGPGVCLGKDESWRSQSPWIRRKYRPFK